MQVKNTKDETITFVVSKAYLFMALGVLLGFAGGFAAAWGLFTTQNVLVEGPLAEPQVQQPMALTQTLLPEFDVEGRPFTGNAGAAVTIVEFTDYQCPFCQRHATQTLPKVMETFGDDIRYVVLNNPLNNIHPYAEKAAQAAECAHDQGKFWEYHDKLFANQAALTVDDLKSYAAQLGLDTIAFDTCLDSGAKEDIVQKDMLLAQNSDVTGTPTFFINGQKLVGAVQFATLQALVEQQLGR